MSNASALFRSLVIYALCLPLAVVLGYLLANPLDLTTFTVVGIILLTLAIPALLRWHHAWLIATWNMSAVIFFLPGRPAIWTGMAAISFVIGVLQYAIDRKIKFLHVPSVMRPLLFLTLVVLITMRLTGGIGLRSFGSGTYGGKNYVIFFAAVVGYFALISRPIPPKRAGLYVLLFFFGTSTIAIGDLAAVLPQTAQLAFMVFPLLTGGAETLQGLASSGPARFTGLAYAGVGIFGVMLARYGIRGIFLDPSKGWRAMLFIGVVFITLLGGFRSVLIYCALTFAVLFYLEGLHQTRLLPVAILMTLLGGTLVGAFANKMPFAMQRSMAFLPLDIDPAARLSAQVTTEWRLQIWRNVLPQVPQYLILGKGYGFSARDLAMIQDTRRSDKEGTELVGDYHNGPLSVLIPFGLFGMLGFLWFLWAGLQVTYHNFRFGDPAYRQANTFILALFIAKTLFFFTIFGAFVQDMVMFCGLLGLNISLNGGVAKPAIAPQPKVVFNRLKLHPQARKPVGI